MCKIFAVVIVCLHLILLSVPHSSAQTSPNSADRQRAIGLYQEKKFDEAQDLLLTVVKTDQQDHLAWYYLGFAYIQQRKLKEASKAFETALNFRPDFAAAHSGLGYSLLFRNKLSAAVSAAQMALKLDANLADAHYVIGVARLRSDHQDEALHQAELALKINPAFAPAHLLKSQALTNFLDDASASSEDEAAAARRDRFAKAAEALEKYLELDPTSAEKSTWENQLLNLRLYSRVGENTLNEKRIFRGKEVTTKARILSKPHPEYPEVARVNGTTGKVVLRAVLAEDGTVKHILVIRGLPDGLTEICIRAAQLISFTPATLNGQSVSTVVQLEYQFLVF